MKNMLTYGMWYRSYRQVFTFYVRVTTQYRRHLNIRCFFLTDQVSKGNLNSSFQWSATTLAPFFSSMSCRESKPALTQGSHPQVKCRSIKNTLHSQIHWMEPWPTSNPMNVFGLHCNSNCGWGSFWSILSDMVVVESEVGIVLEIEWFCFMATLNAEKWIYIWRGWSYPRARNRPKRSYSGTVIPLFMHEGMICMKIRKPTEHEIEHCEMFDVTSIMPWNPHGLTDEQDTMEGTEYAELKGLSDERKMNMKMKKHDNIKQHPKEIADYFFHPKEDILQRTLECTTQFRNTHSHFPMQIHHKSRNPILQEEESMKTMQLIHSQLSPVLKATMEHKPSLESNPNSCHTMGSKLNQMDLIVCWISLERKEYQYPY